MKKRIPIVRIILSIILILIAITTFVFSMIDHFSLFGTWQSNKGDSYTFTPFDSKVVKNNNSYAELYEIKDNIIIINGSKDDKTPEILAYKLNGNVLTINNVAYKCTWFLPFSLIMMISSIIIAVIAFVLLLTALLSKKGKKAKTIKHDTRITEPVEKHVNTPNTVAEVNPAPAAITPFNVEANTYTTPNAENAPVATEAVPTFEPASVENTSPAFSTAPVVNLNSAADTTSASETSPIIIPDPVTVPDSVAVPTILSPVSEPVANTVPETISIPESERAPNPIFNTTAVELPSENTVEAAPMTTATVSEAIPAPNPASSDITAVVPTSVETTPAVATPITNSASETSVPTPSIFNTSSISIPGEEPAPVVSSTPPVATPPTPAPVSHSSSYVTVSSSRVPADASTPSNPYTAACAPAATPAHVSPTPSERRIISTMRTKPDSAIVPESDKLKNASDL